MGSIALNEKPHAVCIPYPAQGHINPMLKVAKLLHNKGFHITFVNSEFNHKRLLKSRGPKALDGLPTFRFETIPDGLPPMDVDATQDIPSLCFSTRKHGLAPFKQLLNKLNDSSDAPPVTCIVSDGVMSFTLDAAEELGVPEVLFWTTSACGFLAYCHVHQLIEKGYTPLKGMEIDNNVKRDEVESLVRELMDGDKGKEMKLKAQEWKNLAHDSIAAPSGSSYINLDKLINQVLLSPKH
ncbi:hypothetical protein LWI29_020459 [Acer saccharum]|uniref:Glycosyltransferase N-terminal domain-containing protein n=1 Tax=Acer saccharum TaxID=4024 RepID=A0AA39RM65_ACESA|nr:hypothetical protein LWI29_020459 [Acer saccharum]